MAPLDDNFSETLASDSNGSEVGRRLSDKILSAFNHAYAVGEGDIAERLKDALEANEARRNNGSNLRTTYDPLGQAEKWVAFVEARNRYKAASATAADDSPELVDVLERMKDAYRLWSMS